MTGMEIALCAHAPQHPHPSPTRKPVHQLLAMPAFRDQLGPGVALFVQADGVQIQDAALFTDSAARRSPLPGL